jgi:hypothetical protein
VSPKWSLPSILRGYLFALGVLWLGVVPLCVPLYFSSPMLALGLIFVVAPFGALIITLVAFLDRKFRNKRNGSG